MAVKERTDSRKKSAEVEEMSADDIDGSFVPRIKPEVDGVEVDGEAVLVIQGRWSVHWLNQISTIVFSEFDGIASIDEVADRLSKAFQADLETVRNDILEMTRQLGMDGFLEGVAAEELRQNTASLEGVPVGTVVPGFELSDVGGHVTSMDDLKGQQTLLVNWSPSCGFCGRIASEIAELQPDLRARGVQTVFISIGTADDLRAQVEEFGLDFPVLMQDEERAEIFSGMGTPAAYLVDAEGKTASKLAYGSDGVPILIRKAAGVRRKSNGSDKKSSGSKKSTRPKVASSRKTAAPKKTAAPRKTAASRKTARSGKTAARR